MRSAWTLGALAVLLAAAPSARAQHLEGDQCVRGMACAADVDPFSPCMDGGGTCVQQFSSAGGARFYCLPHGAIPCCDEPDPFCPSGAGVTYECSTATMAPYEISPGGPVVLINLCVEYMKDYCGATSPDGVTACHRAPGAADPDRNVTWDGGDCDGDGLDNAGDPDPCAPPPRRAIRLEAGGCEALTGACDAGSPCRLTESLSETGSCEVVGGGTLCVPLGGDTSELYCAGGTERWECLADEIEAMVGTERFCVPDTCASNPTVDLADCVRDSDGPTAWDAGDCDLDGDSNSSEANDPERDPCVDESMPDAGPPPTDAGATPTDAGATPTDAGATDGDAGAGTDAGAALDAGRRGDAGTPVARDARAPELDAGGEIGPSFGGGGGCACRATPPRAARGPWLALLALGLAFRRRR